MRTINQPPVEHKQKDPVPVDYVGRLAGRAQRLLGRRVNIIHGARSKKIELFYEDDQDLERLLASLCGNSVFEEE